MVNATLLDNVIGQLLLAARDSDVQTEAARIVLVRAHFLLCCTWFSMMYLYFEFYIPGIRLVDLVLFPCTSRESTELSPEGGTDQALLRGASSLHFLYYVDPQPSVD